MNKVILIFVVVLIIVIGGIVYVSQSPAYKTTNTGATNNVPNTNTLSINNQLKPTQPENLSALVSIKSFAFNPTTLTVKVGTMIVWTNNDAAPHKIKSDTFNSEVLGSGQSFQFTFSAVGEYNYSCAIHPSMLGKIIVTQ